ncbi:hypothetical protein MKW92_001409, partial [Papaver armeniacum]
TQNITEMVIKFTRLAIISIFEVENWYKTEETFQNFMDFHLQLRQELRQTSKSMQQVVNGWDFSDSGVRFKKIEDKLHEMNGCCHASLVQSRKAFTENCRLYNEFLDSKGNVRVYGRLRPCQDKNQTIIQLIGEDGELVIADPSVHTDGGHRFKFNKVYDQQATEEEVFLDTQPVIRSVIDGYNVCIFTFGQSGWENTNTKTGLDASSTKDWGIHFEALNVLFQMSRNRRSSFSYKIDVQMVEIYNEQVRDLLQIGVSHNKICTSSQPSELTVPDASMHPVESVSDVLKFIRIGLAKQARGLTALNERSIRSHSILTVHVHGTDLVTEATLRGSLHLVDLARSGSVDCSQVTRGRLREAQCISKSLSALGDVMFSLSQKNDHVPYADSQLTRVLQSSLSGQGKIAMFVQLNPDVDAYSKTLSTLKFAKGSPGLCWVLQRLNGSGTSHSNLCHCHLFMILDSRMIMWMWLCKDKPSSYNGISSFFHY